MTELLTAAQMRAIEQAAIDSGEVTGLELMERAGQGVVEAIFEEWPELADQDEGGVAPRPADSPQSILAKEKGALAPKKRAVVLCGPGNNGGDGFVVARLMHERGWVVEVFLYGDAEKLPPDARVNYERWCGLGEVQPFEQGSLSSARTPVLIVDAIFGTGLTRPIAEDIGLLLSSLDALRDLRGIKTVAVDVPTGLCADSGHNLKCLTTADLTVTFGFAKIGHYLERAPMQSGRLMVCPIGVESHRPVSAVKHFRPTKNRKLAKGGAHKFGFGQAFVLSGGRCQTGAARLCARGALRMGAGLVTLGVPEDAHQEVASQITAIMMKTVDKADDLATALNDKRINALCVGPALGLDRAKPLVAAALDAGLGARPTVLDADALSAFADEPDALFAMLHEKCVLTPHGGEFARLFPDISEKLNAVPTKGPAYSKVDATREAAKRAGCVVLFKGADTVIADPDGRCSINSAHYERAAPWLATAGSGDVLAGFITGLLARGFAPMAAAETAAWLHVECALKFGPGLIAEDIPEQLPAVFRDLGL